MGSGGLAGGRTQESQIGPRGVEIANHKSGIVNSQSEFADRVSGISHRHLPRREWGGEPQATTRRPPAGWSPSVGVGPKALGRRARYLALL